MKLVFSPKPKMSEQELAQFKAAVSEAVPEMQCQVSWDDMRACIAAGGRVSSARVAPRRGLAISIAAACAACVLVAALVIARLPDAPQQRVQPKPVPQLQVVQPDQTQPREVAPPKVVRSGDAVERPVKRAVYPRHRRIRPGWQAKAGPRKIERAPVPRATNEDVVQTPRPREEPTPPERTPISTDTVGDRVAEVAANALFSLSERMTAENAEAAQQKIANTLVTAMPGS